MREESKENSPLNARRSLSPERESKTKHRHTFSSDEEFFRQDKRSLSSEKVIKTKHKRKRDACSNTLPLAKRSSGRSENFDENKDTAEVVAPRRPRKKIRPLREQVIDLTDDLSEDSTEESPSTDLPSPPPSPVPSKPLPDSRKPSHVSSEPLPVSSEPLPVSSKQVKQKSADSESTNCKYCGEAKDKVTECSAPLEGANKEKDILKFTEIQSSWKISDDLPCVKLVNFRVYDKARHLCPFDEKLIKAEDGLYFSGFVKPYDSEKTDLSDFFPCEDSGPITDWWFEGFDLNDKSSLGLTTKLAYYYLETPMAEYALFMSSVEEKVFLAKIVIDILENVSDDEELSYEGLLDILKDKVPPEGVPTITEEILLKNGVFVCEQIQSYDAAADVDEKIMASMPCMEELSRKVDYDFNSKSDEDSDDDDSDVSICQVGDIERAVIDFIDLDEIESSDDDGNGLRRARRRCRKYYDDFDWLNEDDEVEKKRGRKHHQHRDDDYDNDYDDDEEEREKKPRHRKRLHKAPKGPMRRRSPMRRVMMPTKTIKLSKATTTPLVENIFVSFFSGEIMRNYTRDYSNTASGLTTNRMFNSTKSYDDYNLETPILWLTKLEDTGVKWEECKIRFACEWSDEETSQVSELEHVAETEKTESKDDQADENEVKLRPKDEQVYKNENEIIVPEDEQMHENEVERIETRDVDVNKNEEKMDTDDSEATVNEVKRKPEDTQGLENEKMDTNDSEATVNEIQEKPEDTPEPENKKMETEVVPVFENVEKKSEHEQVCEEREGESELVSEEMKTLRISLPVVREFKSIELKRLDLDVIKFYVNKNNRRKKDDVISLDSSDSESDSEHTSKRKKMSEKSENSDGDGYTVPEFRQMLKRKKTRRSCPAKIRWIDQPLKEIDGYEYYKKVRINDSTVSVGDFISTYNSNSIGCVKYLFENIDEEQLFHIHWFTRSMDTILAEVGHPNELFESDTCEDVLIKEFYQVVTVKFVPTGSDWFETGNMDYVNQLNKNEDPSRFLYYQKRFCEKTARFTDAEPESSWFSKKTFY